SWPVHHAALARHDQSGDRAQHESNIAHGCGTVPCVGGRTCRCRRAEVGMAATHPDVESSPEGTGAAPQGPPPPPPPGPIAQSVAIGFRTVYIAAALLGLLWLTSNVREIASDTQAVVLRFGR